MKSRCVYELDHTHRKICLRSVIPSSGLILVKAGRGSLSARPLTGKCEREPNHIITLRYWFVEYFLL